MADLYSLRSFPLSPIRLQMDTDPPPLCFRTHTDGGKVAQNVAAGVAGVFIPVLWFAMDFQNASGKEAQALNARQQYPGTLAEQRCTAVGPGPGARHRQRFQDLIFCGARRRKILRPSGSG
ncbi:MAG: hypothetical protein J0H44_24255 [Alphaproteobacteria bacterium]|nr:hypothetical protein [Alphaproteobacteria bacterium]